MHLTHFASRKTADWHPDLARKRAELLQKYNDDLKQYKEQTQGAKKQDNVKVKQELDIELSSLWKTPDKQTKTTTLASLEKKVLASADTEGTSSFSTMLLKGLFGMFCVHYLLSAVCSVAFPALVNLIRESVPKASSSAKASGREVFDISSESDDDRNDNDSNLYEFLKADPMDAVRFLFSLSHSSLL